MYLCHCEIKRCLWLSKCLHYLFVKVDREDDPTETDEPRTLVQSLRFIAEIQSKTTESEKRALRTRYGIREIDNPMLAIPADLFKSVHEFPIPITVYVPAFYFTV